jgi:hypothetical protein
MSDQIPESLLDLLQERRKLQKERDELEDPIPAIQAIPTLQLGGGLDQYTRTKQKRARIDEEIGLLNERIAHLRLATKTIEKSSSAARKKGHKPDAIVWLGNNRDFGEKILELFRSGLIRAKSDTDALTQAVKHFVDKNGKPYKARSTLQNTKNKRDFTKSS